MAADAPEPLADAEIRPSDALVIVDAQVDFCPGGALAVPGGGAVIAPINRLAPRFSIVAATQDWHPPDHASFAANREGAAPFETVEAFYGKQVLWPTHCVAGTQGAALHADLDPEPIQLVLRKGFRRDIDSYSAFFENDRKTATGLAEWLKARGAKRLFFAGLATDFCVGWSARDALTLGYDAVLIDDACRGIDVDGSMERMTTTLAQEGARAVSSQALGA